MARFKHEGLFQRPDKFHANGMNKDLFEPIQDMNNGTVDKSSASERLLKFNEVAEFQKINPFIHTGYRGILTGRKCFESIFWWTNETLNIWTHVFGCMLSLGLTIRDSVIVWNVAPSYLLFIGITTGLIYQMAMIFSVLYHILLCRSEKYQRFFLSLDLFGASICALITFLLCIFYGFTCYKEWRIFYIVAVTVLFIKMCVLCSFPSKFSNMMKVISFVCWLTCALVATVHWYFLHGGFENTIVRLVVIGLTKLYVICSMGALVYLLKIPERFIPGKCDFIGSSHQWWHLFMVAALHTAHSNAMAFLHVFVNNACPVP